MTPDHLSLDPKVRINAARSPEATKVVLQALAQDPNVNVRQHVLRGAQHKEDLELLEVFVLDPDPVIRAEIVLSPDCPIPLLRRFRQDPNPAIRGIVESRIGSTPEETVDLTASAPKPEKQPEPLPIPVVVHEPPKEEIEQDEPTGGVNETSRLAPIKEEIRPSPAPAPAPVRAPIVINRPTPLPVRNPIGPGPIRPTPRPFSPPMQASPSPVPAPAPQPLQPSPAPLAETLPADEPVPIVAPKAASPLPGDGQIRIQLTGSDKSVSELSFNQDMVVVGRVIGNDIVLPHGNVSKNHCRIFAINGQLYIEDLKSTNGTQLNKNNIPAREPHPLMPTDEVGIGSSSLKISLSFE